MMGNIVAKRSLRNFQLVLMFWSANSVYLCAIAQGMSEMGSMYSMPKPMPNASIMGNTLNKLYTHDQNYGTPVNNKSDSFLSGETSDLRAKVDAYGKHANKLYELAKEKEKAGNLEEAIKLYAQSLATRQAVWGDKDPNTAKLYCTIGQLYKKQGKSSCAENCFRRSVAVINKRDPGSFEAMPFISILADLLTEEKKNVEARSLYGQLLILQERKSGIEDSSTIPIRAKLAQCCFENGDYASAENYLKKALELTETQTTDNSQLKSLLELYRRVLKATGHNTEAEQIDGRLQKIELTHSASVNDTMQTESGDKVTQSNGLNSDKTTTNGTKAPDMMTQGQAKK